MYIRCPRRGTSAKFVRTKRYTLLFYITRAENSAHNHQVSVIATSRLQVKPNPTTSKLIDTEPHSVPWNKGSMGSNNRLLHQRAYQYRWAMQCCACKAAADQGVATDGSFFPLPPRLRGPCWNWWRLMAETNRIKTFVDDELSRYNITSPGDGRKQVYKRKLGHHSNMCRQKFKKLTKPRSNMSHRMCFDAYWWNSSWTFMSAKISSTRLTGSRNCWCRVIET